MKILMSLSMLLLFSVSASYGQALTEVASTKEEKVANCTPSPECAAKMGMTLEECKKLCSKATAECKAKCLGKDGAESVIEGDAKVAAASSASEIETTDSNLVELDSPVVEKVCNKGSKACCKKKAE